MASSDLGLPIQSRAIYWRLMRVLATPAAAVCLILASGPTLSSDKQPAPNLEEQIQEQMLLRAPNASDDNPVKSPRSFLRSAGESSTPFDINGFMLSDARPAPVVVGSTATVDFRIAVQYADLAAARSAIGALVNRLNVGIDGDALTNSVASIQRLDLETPQRGSGQVLGSAIFTLYSVTAPTFLGVNWGSSHAIYLADPLSGFKSGALTITVRSSIVAIIPIVGGGIFAGLFGVYGLLLHRRRLRREADWERARVVPPVRLETADDTVEDNRRLLPPPSVPGTLLHGLAEGRAILVLAGGASAQAGFPTGSELLGQLVERLQGELPRELIRSVGPRMTATGDGFNKVMDAIVSAVPRDRVIREMGAIISQVRPNSALHKQLANLPWRGVLSMTWDTLADDVFRSAHAGRWMKLTLDQSNDLPGAIKSGRQLFLKMLGELDNPGAVSLSIAEFRRNLNRWPEFQRQIGLLLQTENFLFIGVGADTLEQFLQAVGGDIEVNGRRHFALISDSPEIGLLTSTLSRFGVELIPYTVDHGHQAVAGFVEQLSKDARGASMPRARRKNAQSILADGKIKSVKLANIGLFDELELGFQTDIPGMTGAAWTVIFGPNGCGKSSILRAIGLALCGEEASSAAARLLQVGKSDGSIELQFGSQTIRTRLVRNRSVIVTPTSTTPVQGGLALVVGFPALRGAPSDNPQGVATLEPRGAEPADLLPLVNSEVDHRLGSFKQWLINVLEQAGRGEARAISMKALLDAIIRDVVPGEFKKFAPLDNSYVIKVKVDESERPSLSDVPFDDLSQGMASIFNWLGVLVQRLYDFYPDASEPNKEHAVTLIDEIDAHLHPDWQRRLVELSKKFFPNVQVIATSHSPLLAGALRSKEMCVLDRNRATGRVAPLQFDIDLYGRNSQEILTSVIFGLQTDRNPETERQIHRYYDLFEKITRNPEEKLELEALGSKLNSVSYGAVADPPPAATSERTYSSEETEILRKHFEANERAILEAAGKALSAWQSLRYKIKPGRTSSPKQRRDVQNLSRNLPITATQKSMSACTKNI